MARVRVRTCRGLSRFPGDGAGTGLPLSRGFSASLDVSERPQHRLKSPEGGKKERIKQLGSAAGHRDDPRLVSCARGGGVKEASEGKDDRLCGCGVAKQWDIGVGLTPAGIHRRKLAESSE